ncbi:MAG: hypothetical protein U0797_27260 [Gemmataceae bacterium]
MPPTKSPPVIGKVAGGIKITGQGDPNEQIDIVIKKQPGNTVVYNQTHHLPVGPAPVTGEVTIPLANGTYLVKVTAHPAAGAPVIYESTETVP